MSKKTYYIYQARGGVCIAADLHGHVPHTGDYCKELEKELANTHGTPQVCKKCRCLFQPERWDEYEEYEDE